MERVQITYISPRWTVHCIICLVNCVGATSLLSNQHVPDNGWNWLRCHTQVENCPSHHEEGSQGKTIPGETRLMCTQYILRPQCHIGDIPNLFKPIYTQAILLGTPKQNESRRMSTCWVKINYKCLYLSYIHANWAKCLKICHWRIAVDSVQMSTDWVQMSMDWVRIEYRLSTGEYGLSTDKYGLPHGLRLIITYCLSVVSTQPLYAAHRRQCERALWSSFGSAVPHVSHVLYVSHVNFN